MSEYIDRAALKRELAPYEENDFPQQMDVILAIVDAQPTANVVEVRHGRWIELSRSSRCSECGFEAGRYEPPRRYCPECGARMGGEAAPSCHDCHEFYDKHPHKAAALMGYEVVEDEL